MGHKTENNLSVFRRSLGHRLKQERTRLNMRQADLADMLDTTEQTIRAWESGRTAPDAAQLAVLAAQGMDAQYVVTGERSRVNVQMFTTGPNGVQQVSDLSDGELTLLDTYRHVPAQQRKFIDDAVAMASAASTPNTMTA